MSKVVVGVCEINDRRHLVGIWASFTAAFDDLKGYATPGGEPAPFKNEGWEPEGYTHHFDGCMAIWMGIDGDREPADMQHPKGYIGSDAEGFTLYEVDLAGAPGFFGFSED